MDISSNALKLRQEIFSASQDQFNQLALDLFAFQYEENALYRNFCDLLKKKPRQVHTVEAIPFIPISFFKHHAIRTTAFEPQIIFESSGTTGSATSRHEIRDLSLYEESFLTGFDLMYGKPSDYSIIGLLPSYLERKHSSLVYMVDKLITLSNQKNSGFYLYEYDKLHQILLENEQNQIPTLLIGVTFALLDFAEAYRMNLKHTIVMETGGMKGRKKELTRDEVHDRLKKHLGLTVIHSEYGMTELLSQAYAKSDGLFSCPPWMKALIRSEDDPMDVCAVPASGRSSVNGVINIIDLANIYGCAFIATDDLGKLFSDGRFEVLGRLDNSDIRGCSLMVE